MSDQDTRSPSSNVADSKRVFLPTLPQDSDPFGIYVHLPFCTARCRYCGFVSGPHDPVLEEVYANAIIKETALWANASSDRRPLLNLSADTLYFGGGCPSLLETDLIAQIVEACRSSFRLSHNAEITIELNPETVKASRLQELAGMGINRISLGVQSLLDEDLRRMGRRHTADHALWAFAELRDAGFENISLDLIAGYPGQKRDSFKESLLGALQLRPEHISAYLLEVKPGTPLARDIDQGVSPPVDDDLAADMYEDLLRIAGEYGYEHYEISNFALPGMRSRHNLKYWRDVPFLGLGAAAHGMTGRVRYAHVEDAREYVAKVTNGDLPFADYRELTGEERLKDALIMGLRLLEGIDLGNVSDRCRVDVRPFIEETIGDLIEIGLCKRTGDRLRLTDRGRLLSNMVFARWL